MSSRETVIEFIRNLPEEISLPEIAREIELLAGIQKAREQANRNEGIPAEEAHKLVATWASNMPISIDRIVEELREMPEAAVAELIDRIMAARHGRVEQSLDRAWKSELDRRIAEIELGKAKGIPLKKSLARAHKIAGL